MFVRDKGHSKCQKTQANNELNDFLFLFETPGNRICAMDPERSFVMGLQSVRCSLVCECVERAEAC